MDELTKRLTTKEVKERMTELTKGEYLLLGEYINSKTKTLVKHTICGNEYKVKWNNFQSGKRCPFCSKKPVLDSQKIDKRIEELVGDEYIRLSEYRNANTKMLIKHNICGNEYRVTLVCFQRGSRCPKCKESKGEKAISDILNSLNIKYTSQKRFEECRYKNVLPFDFYIHNKKSKLLIEFDGKQHFKSVEHFGGEKVFRITQLRDKIKNDFAKEKNIPLLRIPYTEQNNIEKILTEKLKELNFI